MEAPFFLAGARVSVTPRRLLNRSRRYGKSILDQIREATSGAQVRSLLGTTSRRGASSGTRRKWAKAAEIRLAVLEAAK
jgi:hypothetical protein